MTMFAKLSISAKIYAAMGVCLLALAFSSFFSIYQIDKIGRELQAIADPGERKAAYEEMVANMYERGKAVNTASQFELDDVIDPADSRKWIAAALRAVPPPAHRTGKKRPNVDTW